MSRNDNDLHRCHLSTILSTMIVCVNRVELLKGYFTANEKLIKLWALGKEWNELEWNGMVWNGMEWNGILSETFSFHLNPPTNSDCPPP